MKYGINIIEGYKLFQLNDIMKEHPALWFYDEELGKYYIFSMTSKKDTHINENLLCFGETKYSRSIIYAINVKEGNYVEYKKEMYLQCCCAVIDEKYVSTMRNIQYDASIIFSQKYKCSNYFDLVNQCFKLIREEAFLIECYDANVTFDFDYTNKKIEKELPTKIYNFIENSLNGWEV